MENNTTTPEQVITAKKMKMTKDDLIEKYADFISDIYRYDTDNHKEYEKVEGLMDAMRKIYKQYQTTDLFLMNCIIKEINKISKKNKKHLAVSK